MEYRLVTGLYGDFLNNLNHYLSKGWELYGNPFFIGTWRGSLQYAQAIVKRYTDPFIVITGSIGMLRAEVQKYHDYGYVKLTTPKRTGELIEVAGDMIPEFAIILKKVNQDNTTGSV